MLQTCLGSLVAYGGAPIYERDVSESTGSANQVYGRPGSHGS